MTLSRFIRISEVQRIVGLSNRRIYKLISDGQFPKPVPVSAHTVAWLEEELAEWKASRIALRDSGQFTKFAANGRHAIAIAELCE